MKDHSASLRPEDLLEHASWAHALARSLVGEGAADDLVQETWVAALWAEPDSGRPLRPWLGTVLGNFARQRARRRDRRAAREERGATPEALPSAADLTEKAESQKLLMEELLGLDESLREVLLLRYFEELSSAEIARRQGIPASTVKSRLQRGLDELRVRLDRRCGAEEGAWGLALAPLLRKPSLDGAATGLSSSLKVATTASGAIWMKTFLQLALWTIVGLLGAIALIVVVGVGLPFFESIPREQVSFTALEPVVVQEDGSTEEAPTSLGSRTPITETAATPRQVPVAAPSTLRVRFLDTAGRPVSGVRLALRRSQASSAPTSDSHGRVEVALDPARRGPRGSLRYSHASLAGDLLHFEAKPGEVVDLGDIIVRPGGSLSGRVIDGSGAPLVGADVSVQGAEVSRGTSGGLTMHTTTQLGAASTESDEEGFFRLEGLLAGDVRVEVDAQRGLHRATSGWVEIRPGQESQGLVIRAPAAPADERIEGVVLDPDGEPLRTVSVQARYKTWTRSGSLGSHTDSEGRFRIVTAVDAEHELVFTPPQGRDWTPVILEDARPGQLALRIQFERAGELGITVRAENGQAVTSYACALQDADEEHVLQYLERAERADGRATLRLPAQAFVIRVDAAGFAVETIGPIGRGQLEDGENLSIVLHSLPGVSGRVTSGGIPIEGAEVYLQRRATQKESYNGFPVRFTSRHVAWTKSAADGSYSLDLRDSGEYVVRARAQGLAPGETDSLHLSPEVGVDDLDLDLTSGGSIGGQILLDPDQNPAGAIVAISRGDCWAETRRVESDGGFLFENLIPGPWLVTRVDEELNEREHYSSSTFFGFAHDSTPSNCRVVDGETTRHDFIDTPLPICVLRGRLELVGVDMSTWRARVSDPRPSSGPVNQFDSEIAMDADGRFEVRVPGDGPWRISFGERDGIGLRLLTTLELSEGSNEWSSRIEVAELVLQGTPPAPSAYVWEGSDGLQAIFPLVAEGVTEHHLQPIPAGGGRIAQLDPLLADDDPGKWPTLFEVDVSAGQKGVVAFPR